MDGMVLGIVFPAVLENAMFVVMQLRTLKNTKNTAL
jgi:hypothetical protein